MIDCTTLDEQLVDLLDGTLDAAAQAAAEQHLGRCEACRALVADLRAVRAAFADVADEDVSSAVAAAVLEAAREVHPEATRGAARLSTRAATAEIPGSPSQAARPAVARGSLRRAWRAAALLAAAALVAVVLWPEPVPSVDAVPPRVPFAVLLDEARGLQQAGDQAAAVSRLGEALAAARDDGDRVLAHRLLAAAHAELGDLEQALRALQVVLDGLPDPARREAALLAWGQDLAARGQLGAARFAFQQLARVSATGQQLAEAPLRELEAADPRLDERMEILQQLGYTGGDG